MKGTIHWVSAEHAFDAEVRLYDRLFSVEDPSAEKESDFKNFLNLKSLEIIKFCKLEPSLIESDIRDRYQFERLGYFCLDALDSNQENLVFNRIVPLRDSWAKIEKSK